VAEWQTRQTQNLLSERTWEFKSPRPHHDEPCRLVTGGTATQRSQNIAPTVRARLTELLRRTALCNPLCAGRSPAAYIDLTCPLASSKQMSIG
jgi:hypothetical protein